MVGIYEGISASRFCNTIQGYDEEYDHEYDDEYEYHDEIDDDDLSASAGAPAAEPTKKRYGIVNNEATTHECSICLESFEEIPADQLSTVQNCHHKFCKECLANYISFKASDASCIYHNVTLFQRERKPTLSNKNVFRLEVLKTYGIPCPALGCQHIMLIHELVPLATSKAIEQFIKFSRVHQEDITSLEKQLEEEEHARLEMEEIEKMALCCPRCAGPTRKTRRNRRQCKDCLHPFCSDCRENHGVYDPCGTKRGSVVKIYDHCPFCKQDNLKLKGQRLCCNHCKNSFCNNCGGDHSIRTRCVNAADGFLFRQFADLRRCPGCKSLAAKNEGCNFITCRCQTHFCNLCCSKLTMAEHWDHFFGSPYGDKCKGSSEDNKK